MILLTDTNVKHSRIIRLNWYKIRCYDLHGMVVNRKLEVSIESGVDDPQSIRSSGRKGYFEPRATIIPDIGTIDEPRL